MKKYKKKTKNFEMAKKAEIQKKHKKAKKEKNN